MKSLFPGYYRPSDDEFKKLWADAIVSFDTNVLLNLYRLDKASSDKFIKAIKRFGSRVWLPFQVAKEFVNRRVDVIREQLSVYDRLRTAVSEAVDGLKKTYTRHPFIPLAKLNALYDEMAAKIGAELDQSQKDHQDTTHNDPISDELDGIFAANVGAKPEDKDHETAIKECEKRFTKGLPPGNEDKGKGGERQYGDAVLWLQLLDYAEKNKKPVILVTDDSKKDWWHMVGGNTVGPRPELIQEMRDRAKVGFYLYRSSMFLELALKDEPGKDKAVQDVKVVEQTPEPVVVEGRKAEGYYGLVRDTLARDYWAAALANVPNYKDIMADQYREWSEVLRAATAAHASMTPLQRAVEQMRRELASYSAISNPTDPSIWGTSDALRAALEKARAAKEVADIAETAKQVQKDLNDVKALGRAPKKPTKPEEKKPTEPPKDEGK